MKRTLLALLLSTTAVPAATYDVSLTTSNSVGYDKSGTVTGQIVTTCDNCWLDAYNVTAWNFAGVDGVRNGTISSDNPNAVIWGTDQLYATPTTLYYRPSAGNFCFCETGPTPSESHQMMSFYWLNGGGNWFFLNALDANGQYVPPSYLLDLDVPIGTADFQIGTAVVPLPSPIILFAGGLFLLTWLTKRR